MKATKKAAKVPFHGGQRCYACDAKWQDGLRKIEWVRCSVKGCKADLYPRVADARIEEFGVVLCEGHADEERAFAEGFLWDNRDGLDEDEQKRVRGIRPGEQITLGGGAAAIFVVTRDWEGR